jgi:hypothetical protein
MHDGEPSSPDKELAALLKAIADRQAAELQKYRDLHALETQRLNYELKIQLREAAERIDAIHKAERVKLREEHTNKPLFGDRMKYLLKFVPASKEIEVLRKEADALVRLQQQERKDLFALEVQTTGMQREELRERQAKQLKEVQSEFAKERDRYIRERQEAKRLLDDIPKKSLKDEFQPRAGRSL